MKEYENIISDGQINIDIESNFPVALCIVNALDSITFCNDAFTTLIEKSREELLGNEVNNLFKEREEFKITINNVIEKKEKQSKVLTLNGDNNKEEDRVKITVVGQRDEDDVFSGYLLLVESIKEESLKFDDLERRLIEKDKELIENKEKMEEVEAVMSIRINAKTKELREVNESLEEKVRERTKELEEKAVELEEKAEDKEKAQIALLNLAEDAEQATQQAEREKEKTMLIVNNFVDGLLFFDTKDVLNFINPKAEQMLDVKLRDIEGRDMVELLTFPTLEPVIKIATNLKKSGNKSTREEITIEGDIYYEVTVIPIKREKSEAGLLINIHDITREKGIEKIKSEFVSVAAHQLRTPLSGIKWTLQTIIEEEDEVDIPEEVMGFIKKAYEANDRMVHLVNDLLNVSRIEEGRYAYEKEVVDFIETVKQMVEDYKEHIEKRGLVFNYEKPVGIIPKVKVDKEKITMVIQNFLDNAMKYTKEGEVTLKIEGNEDKLKVSVTDTGVGIPIDQQKRMFNKFFRAANVQRMDTEGSGLGMFIAKNIVEAHDGEIGFTSVHGEGSTFYFTLPGAKEDVDDLFKAF